MKNLIMNYFTANHEGIELISKEQMKAIKGGMVTCTTVFYDGNDNAVAMWSGECASNSTWECQEGASQQCNVFFLTIDDGGSSCLTSCNSW